MIAYFWVFPAACGLFAIIAPSTILPALLHQKSELEKHKQRLKALGSTFDISRAERAMERVRADFEAMPALIARAKTALKTLQSAGKVLSMRRARTAVALAVLSIRALAVTLRARA
ncbi:MAG TPA: hypothetical protein VN936_07725 [Candidatus Acidoferrum sp.]|nr:hypothetical protein [Candidatus Acidoferrum sp.]